MATQGSQTGEYPGPAGAPAEARDEATMPEAPADGIGYLTGAHDSFGFGVTESWSLSGELPAGADLGGVTIQRLLAEGGMGRVYEARQDAPRRTVAVKVISEGAVSAAACERLLHEAETLARLRHPNIAQIHTFGTAPAAFGGVPFFVMEFVDNARSITRFAATRALSVRGRVTLFAKVCAAVAHGHGQGVIHRDLKPANILVDAHGDPKVIDYGIARGVGEKPAAADGAAAAPEASDTGDVVGTLRYMSPEQVLAPEGGPDARSDVYALGLVLHELVSGRLPYELAGRSFGEAVRILGNRSAPATAVVEKAAMAEERRDDARALAIIVAKCLEPAAADRYASAGELAADLGRWLDGRAIDARPPSTLESLRRLTRRHRFAVAAGAGLAITLVAATVAVSLLSLRLDRQRRVVQQAHDRAATEAAAARRQLYASTVLLAASARDRDNLAEARHLLEESGSMALDAFGSRPIELSCLAATLDDSLDALQGSDSPVTAVAWSPDGRMLACGDRAGVIRLHGMAPGGQPARVIAPHAGVVWSLAFSPDGGLLAAVGDGMVSIHEVPSGKVVQKLEAGSGTVYGVAFSPDGSRLATASQDHAVRLWDVATGEQAETLQEHEGSVYGVAFAPDGSWIVTCSHDGTVRVWDAGTGRARRTLRGHTDRVFDVAVSADGRRVASAAEDGTVRLWDAKTGIETACLRHAGRVNAIAFAADNDRVATAGAEGVLRIWDVDRGVEVAHLRGHSGGVWSVAWCAASGRLATGAADGSVRLWAAETGPDVLPLGSRVLAAVVSPDGTTVATGTDDAEVRLWDAATLEPRGSLGPAIGRVNGVAWSPDGALVAGACDDGVLFVWDGASRERHVAVQAHAKRIYAVAFSPDSGRVATASEDRTVSLRDPRSGAVVGPILRHTRRVFCAAFAPTGTHLATACEDRVVRLWDVASGTEVRDFTGHSGPVNWVAFSPDGSRIATASSDGTVRLWRGADASVEKVLAGSASQVWKVAFSPDGTRVAGAAADGTIHLWDAETGRSALTLQGHRDQVWAVAFARDGRSLFSGGWDGTLRVWGADRHDLARRRAAAPHSGSDTGNVPEVRPAG